MTRRQQCLFSILSISLIAIGTLGCGSKPAETASATANSPNSFAGGSTTTPSMAGTSVANTSVAGGQASPSDVVSQFLDRIRRGGQDSAAGALLTQTAQSELARIGRNVQPIGSPDAKYTVTRSSVVPGQPDASLVQCTWQEPRVDGGVDEYQVVWALQQEPVGWRISGLAMELDPNQDPMIIDFEDGAAMARLLSTPAQTSSETTAAANQGTLDR